MVYNLLIEARIVTNIKLKSTERCIAEANRLKKWFGVVMKERGLEFMYASLNVEDDGDVWGKIVFRVPSPVRQYIPSILSVVDELNKKLSVVEFTLERNTRHV